MRIGIIAPIIESVPPKKYGGTERVVYYLTEELVKRGHDVTLFASGDSKTSANLVSVYPTSLRSANLGCTANGTSAWSMLNVGLAYQHQHEFDIIHDHTHVLGLPTANLATTPVVMTLHDPVFSNYKQLLETLTGPNIVTISEAQALDAPGMNHVGTVYNGLDMKDYPFSRTHDGYLLFFGSFRPEKGAHNAIAVAKKLHLPLVLAGKLDDWQVEYFKREVEPHLSDSIRFIGELDEKKRNRLMSRAMALLHPISWHEPFGLTLIEANACGAPVIAFDEGSSSELIVDGKTGFLVNTVEEMAEAVMRLDDIDRAYCRTHALQNFNARRMAEGYEKIYKKVLSQKIKQVKIPSLTAEPAVQDIRKFVFSPDFS